MEAKRFLPRAALQSLVDVLREQGYRVIGPQVQDGAIQYRDLHSADYLPYGWTDDQSPGTYRLTHVDSPRCFTWATGPQALKPLLFSPREVLWRVTRDADGQLGFADVAPPLSALAVIGVRACDLAALAMLDRHFLDGIVDPTYAARRERLFTVVVHCAFPADTCFCASTGDGPRATAGFDLALSELDGGFVVESGSQRGTQVIAGLPCDDADPAQVLEADAEIAEAARRQFRQLPGRSLQPVLFERLDHLRWQQVAERCLACGNCTSVCPTCFCHAEADTPALDGTTSEHLREWDSCFGPGHAWQGHQTRPETAQRYRQWLTHKLGSWHEQFGRSGCVGCGRCITWCPVGIDLTEEANVICDPAAPGVTP